MRWFASGHSAGREIRRVFFCAAVAGSLAALGGGAGAIELPPMTTQAVNPAAESTTMTSSVSALMVYGEDKFQMKSQRAIRVLTKNVNDPVASLLDIPLEQVFSFSPEDTEFNRALAGGAQLHSSRILKPLFLSRIAEAPFIKVRPEIVKGTAAWAFKITELTAGETVFQKHGGVSEWPAVFQWDGIGSNRNWVLAPGKQYNWQLTFADSSGRTLKRIQDTVAFPAVLLARGRERVIVLSLQELFKTGSRSQLSRAGRDLLDDCSDFYRESGADRMEIWVRAGGEAAPGGPGSVIGGYLARRLLMAAERMQIRPAAQGKSGGEQVEIRFNRNH